MLTILIILLVLAVVLPMLGVSTDPNVMRVIVAVLVIALIVWLVGGSGLVVR